MPWHGPPGGSSTAWPESWHASWKQRIQPYPNWKSPSRRRSTSTHQGSRRNMLFRYYFDLFWDIWDWNDLGVWLPKIGWLWGFHCMTGELFKGTSNCAHSNTLFLAELLLAHAASFCRQNLLQCERLMKDSEAPRSAAMISTSVKCTMITRNVELRWAKPRRLMGFLTQCVPVPAGHLFWAARVQRYHTNMWKRS